MDTTQIRQLTDAFRAITAPDAITPDTVATLIEAVATLLIKHAETLERVTNVRFETEWADPARVELGIDRLPEAHFLRLPPASDSRAGILRAADFAAFQAAATLADNLAERVAALESRLPQIVPPRNPNPVS